MRSRLCLHSLLVMALLGIIACASNDRIAKETDADQGNGQINNQIIRGYAVFGHEVRSFRPCDTDSALWTTDYSGSLWDLHKELAPTQEPYAELFAVVKGRIGPAPADGFGADYPGELVVAEVLYVAREGLGCEADWSRFTYRAQGNEPFWAVEVGPEGMRLMQPGAPETVWVNVHGNHTDQGWIFASADKDSPPAKLTIERNPCRDTMSGAYFSLSATLQVGTKEMKGCALLGDAVRKH